MKTQRKRSPLRFSPVFGPKFGEDQTKKRSSIRFNPVFGPKLGEDQNKKGLHSDSVRFCAQTFCPSYKGGIPQFRILFYVNYTIPATQRGAWNHAPPKYAPVFNKYVFQP